MGDTMHSFKSLKNVILGNKQSPKEEWPKELIDYESKYHCLANFWVIPMSHGRALPARLNKNYDSLDAYLKIVEDWYSNNVDSGDIKNTEKYFQNFTDYEFFFGIHCMSGHKTSDNPLEIYTSKDKKGCIDEIQSIYDFWDKRSSEIAKKYTSELYDYFDDLGLINVAKTTN